MRAYAGDELDAQLEHALVGAVLEHDAVRRRLHLQELQLAALADDLADVHPADQASTCFLSEMQLLQADLVVVLVSVRTWFRRRRCLQ